MDIDTKELLEEVWNTSLFDAIFTRRSRRVGFLSQNILLTENAMGLGGWPFGGFTAMIALGGTPMHKGLGFRFETAEHGPLAGFPYPIGKDGLFETSHPYYKGSMDDAVDAIIEKKWGDKGIFNPENAIGAPYKKPGQMELGIPRTDDDIVQCTKDILNAGNYSSPLILHA